MNNEEKNLSNEENDLPVEEVLEENSQAEEKTAKKLPKGALIGIIAGAAAIIIAIVLIIALSGNKTCEHTFSDKWYNDADNHWHPATCEHAETEKGDFAPHVDANEDGLCDVCEYEVGHSHTFNNDWTVTETHHWKDATCSHSDEKKDYSTHSDEDMNGSCDLCSGHVHKTNGAGYCIYSDCGKQVYVVDETNLDSLVNAVVAQSWLVNSGNIDYTFTGRSNTGPAFEVFKQDLISYVFGKDNYTHVQVSTDITNGGVHQTGTFESWHQLMGADQTFGVVSENGGELALDIAEAAKLNGYYIALSTLAGDYGVEATLYALYEAAIADTTDELIVIPDTAENKVTFKYSYKTVFINENKIAVGDENTPAGSTVYNVNLFDVEVTFTYNDDFALTGLMIAVDCYTNDPGTADGIGFLYDDVDIEYNPDTDEVTFVEYVQVKNENAEEGDPEYIWVTQPTDRRTPDTYVINVTQTVGARTEENPNSQSKFTPTNFDLFYTLNDNGSLENKFNGEIIQGKKGKTIQLFVGNCTPAGTSIHFTHQMVSMKVYRNNVEISDFESYDNEMIYATFTYTAGEQRLFMFIPKTDGVFKFEIFIGDKKVHQVTLAVEIKEEDDKYLDLDDNEYAVRVNEAYSWTTEFSYTATEGGVYYITVPAGIGIVNADAYDAAEKTPETDDSPEPYFDYNIDGKEKGGSFKIELEAGETIRFYVNARQVGTYIIKCILF